MSRALREEMYRAYITRASSGDLDNTPIIEQVRLLGFSQICFTSRGHFQGICVGSGAVPPNLYIQS
jgi:hypothetical protein